ncbi:MAG: acid phosphatase [Massilia sp.]|nr:acid phosphatase [Massilia sp.]
MLPSEQKLIRPIVRAACGIAVAVSLAQPAQAALPRYDHVVIVVMENHGLSQVVGNPAAPYITSLSLRGANFTDSHGIAHPSQPNYLAIFSGSTQGITDDSCPHTFKGVNNLGAQLLASGLTFAGYSESLPSAGYSGCSSGKYARKHNPWVNFPNVPVSSNLPYSAFPTDYATLPAVSFVVPNLISDMHDGSIGTGDLWLKANIDAFVQWASAHSSLLILTFDEDDSATSANRVPTILVGADIKAGTYTEPVNHYNILATIESIFRLPALTPATPIVAPFVAHPPAQMKSTDLDNRRSDRPLRRVRN